MINFICFVLFAFAPACNGLWKRSHDPQLMHPGYPKIRESALQNPKLLIVKVETRDINERIIGIHSPGRFVSIGKGLPWNGYDTKVDYLLQLLKIRNDYHPNSLTMFVDSDVAIASSCYDADIVAAHQYIKDRSGADIIFSAEITLFEAEERRREVPAVPAWASWDRQQLRNGSVRNFFDDEEKLQNSYFFAEWAKDDLMIRNLNSGLFIGTTSNLLEMVTEVKRKYHQAKNDKVLQARYRRKYKGFTGPGDQRFYWNYFLDNPDKVTLDYRMQLFQNMQLFDAEKMFSYKNKALYDDFTEQKACVMHFQGTAKKHAYRKMAKMFGRVDQLQQERFKNLRLPTVFQLGTSKCGTSSLFKTMLDDPKICAPANSNPVDPRCPNAKVKKSPGWFHHPASELLDGDNLEQMSSHFEHCPVETTLQIDATEGYASSLRPAKSIFRLYDHAGKHPEDLKFIMIIRDPVERAYSWYNFAKGKIETFPQYENVTFEDTVDDNIKLYENCLNEKVVDRENDPRIWEKCGAEPNGDFGAVIMPGMYAKELKYYFKWFKPSQFLVFDMKQYRDNFPELISAVTKFLNLSGDEGLFVSRQEDHGRASYDFPDEMPQNLLDFFERENHELGVLIDKHPGTFFGADPEAAEPHKSFFEGFLNNKYRAKPSRKNKKQAHLH